MIYELLAKFGKFGWLLVGYIEDDTADSEILQILKCEILQNFKCGISVQHHSARAIACSHEAERTAKFLDG